MAHRRSGLEFGPAFEGSKTRSPDQLAGAFLLRPTPTLHGGTLDGEEHRLARVIINTVIVRGDPHGAIFGNC